MTSDATPAPATLHPQVVVTVGEWKAEVDEELAPLIQELWIAGLPTFFSCQEHPHTGKVWIGFSSGVAAEMFLNAVAIHQRRKSGSLWRRAMDWGFGIEGPTSRPLYGGDWEYHLGVFDDAYDDETDRFIAFGTPRFAFTISVLFPRHDLRTVTDRMRFFNEQAAKTAAASRSP